MRKGLNYALSCRGAPYVWWPQDLDYLPERSPSWSCNDSPPDPSEVIAEGCFCAGVPNLMLRAEGKKIPDHVGDEVWDGGVKAYGDAYWNMGVIKEFDINDCEEGDLLIRYFDWDRLNATGDQGHVAVVLASGYVLQSYDAGGGYPGVNSNATIEDSHAGGYYEGMIKAADWIGSDSEAQHTSLATAGSFLTADHLLAIMPTNLSAKYAAYYLLYLSSAMQEFGITTKLQAAAFLSNLGHESGDLYYWEEIWGPTEAQAGYEGRTDLGNYYEGDGYRYRGRGPIQLTGRANYRTVGQVLSVDLEGNPDLASSEEIGFRIAGRFWAANGIGPYADAGNFSEVVRIINGGYNGWDDRVQRYNTALSVLPEDSSPAAANGGGESQSPNYLSIGEDGYAQFGGEDWTNGYLIWDGTAPTQTPCLYVPEYGKAGGVPAANGRPELPNYLSIGKDGYALLGGEDWTNGYLIWDGTATTQTPCLYVPEYG